MHYPLRSAVSPLICHTSVKRSYYRDRAAIKDNPTLLFSIFQDIYFLYYVQNIKFHVSCNGSLPEAEIEDGSRDEVAMIISKSKIL